MWLLLIERSSSRSNLSSKYLTITSFLPFNSIIWNRKGCNFSPCKVQSSFFDGKWSSVVHKFFHNFETNWVDTLKRCLFISKFSNYLILLYLLSLILLHLLSLIRNLGKSNWSNWRDKNENHLSYSLYLNSPITSYLSARWYALFFFAFKFLGILLASTLSFVLNGLSCSRSSLSSKYLTITLFLSFNAMIWNRKGCKFSAL